MSGPRRSSAASWRLRPRFLPAREAAWLGHVIEYVALELQGLAGAQVSGGKTRSVKSHPGVYNDEISRFCELNLVTRAGLALREQPPTQA